MDFGASMFFTDYSMTPAALARTLEERGFESVWAPEHSHIPTSRKTPFPQGGELPKTYYEAMDPFVAEDPEQLRRCRELVVARVVVSLPSAPADQILPILDRWCALISRT